MRSPSTIVLTIATIVMMIAMVFQASASFNESVSDDRINALVTIAPQQRMVEAIGGEYVYVTLMVPSGQDPHSYEPTYGDIKTAASADIYFKIGSDIDFELTKMNTLIEVNPKMEIIDCSENIALIEQRDHHHHHGEEGHGEGNDPHIWLSPKNLKQMARNVCDGLIALDSEHSEEYEQNFKNYAINMDSLHERISSELSPYRDEEFMVFHPAWGYFAKEYGLNQIAVEQEKQNPGPRGLSNIIDRARERNIHVIFISPQIDDRGARIIADEIRGEVVSSDPLSPDLETELFDLAIIMSKGFNGQRG
ncbi:MAG: zinc ABC transporter solute-binding protein [Euryarchaeota archaeon]|nr:zinc ABC transporter solute-binding protein [Euryarchaeota archaeon]